MSIPVMLFFSTLITLLFFVVGITIGWTANDFFYNVLSPETNSLHPEMYDDEGIFINEELLAVRFVEDDEDYDDE